MAFSPSHNLTLPDMPTGQIETVVETWTKLYGAHLAPTSPLSKTWEQNPLSKDTGFVSKPKAQYRYMQIFENKGDAMGCSNPHPHCQAWTVTGIPEEPGHEFVQMANYQKKNGRSLLEDYARLETQKQERVVFENKAFLVVCPWWAVWPFEVMIVCKSHKHALIEFDQEERGLLAEAIHEVTTRYDNLFQTQFPYSEFPVHIERH
jgi:UDPglucose--hexose-1-phosphate uridylyltransferase